MKNVIVANSGRVDAETGRPAGIPSNAVSGQWPDFNGKTVWDCMIGDNDPMPTGDIMGVFDYATGQALTRTATFRPRESTRENQTREVTYDGSPPYAQVHLYAGQKDRG